MGAKKTISPEELRARLQKIMEKAAGQNGRITTAEVDGFFTEDDFSGQQMKFVYDFLLSRKIIVDGYTAENQEAPAEEADENQVPWTEEESRWLETYMEDIHEIRPAKEGEWEKLLAGLAGEDIFAMRRISELFLPEVVEEAKKMYTPGVHLSDIIQEASLNLVIFVDSLSGRKVQNPQDLREEMMSEIRSGIRAMLAEQKEVHARDHKLVEKVEDLKDGVTTLKQEFGRKVYLDEVADFMNITEEEAEDILKLAGEEMSDEAGSESK